MSRSLKPALGPAVAAVLAALLAGGAAAAQADSPEAAARQAQLDAQRAHQQGGEARMEARRARQQADQVRDHARRVVVQRLGEPGDRAEHLRNILQLRPNQEPALTAYLDAMKPKMEVRRLDAEADGRTTTPERLAAMEARIAEREAASRARIEATRRFYAQLDERQKKAFDELPLMMGPGPFGPMPMRAVRFLHDGPDGAFRHDLMPPPPAPPAPPAPPPRPPGGV
jgi:hypothetical protein